MQLDLIEWNQLSPARYHQVIRLMRAEYWWIRNLRGGKFGQARLRKQYRKVAALKTELLLAGYEKRHVLDIMACCRGSCSATKQPFIYCPHCGQGRPLSDTECKSEGHFSETEHIKIPLIRDVQAARRAKSLGAS